MDSAELSIFEKLFKELFKPLTGFACQYVKDLDDAKVVVHDAFVALWEKWNTLPQDTNYQSYLYTAVRNRCLNLLRDKKNTITIDEVPEHVWSELNTNLETAELAQAIDLAINSLPEKCREVFELSRLEGLKYSQIADKMNISEKTVEAQITKALKLLRDRLGEFLGLFLFLFLR